MRVQVFKHVGVHARKAHHASAYEQAHHPQACTALKMPTKHHYESKYSELAPMHHNSIGVAGVKEEGGD